MSADFNSLEMGSSNYLPLLRSMDSPGQTVSLKSEKFEMDLGLVIYGGQEMTLLGIKVFNSVVLDDPRKTVHKS
jgi:hypothetical protein